MSDTTTTPMADEGLIERTYTDVWSRTAPKYRVRAVVLLAVNLLLFAGLGCFAYWLRTGIPVAPAVDGYWSMFADTFRPRGDATLANFVVFPIRVDLIPMHAVVVGLLLAALVSIPILISILYRFPCAIPFILVVCFLAVMPWLAINLIGACILASVRPFRLRFRYASALIGLLLVLLYFYGASRQSAMPVELYKPEDRIKFMAPWILATLGSCLLMGGVLWCAKLVDYRPGVVAPLLVVCFAVPVVLFERHVGRDALYYQLVEDHYRRQFFVRGHSEDQDVSDWFERLAYEVWQSKPEPKPPFETVRTLLEFRISIELDAESQRRNVFAEESMALVDECNWFIRQFPDSDYAPMVLYLKGQTLDMRIDLSAFRERKVIRYYDDFPSPQSEFTWQRVLHNAPDADIAAMARYKLSVFDARQGAFSEATGLLQELIDKYAPPTTQPARRTGGVRTLLDSRSTDARLKVPVDQTLFDAQQLLSLLQKNDRDPRYGIRPLTGSQPREPRQPGLLQLDPHHPKYRDNLLEIIAAYPHCLLEDNLRLKAALQSPEPAERIAQLEEVIELYPHGDARPEAHYRLGVAHLDSGNPVRARDQFDIVIRDYPETLWADQSRDRLRAMPAVASEGTS